MNIKVSFQKQQDQVSDEWSSFFEQRNHVLEKTL